ncbi:MAG: type IV secretion system DNA-binding domain-containing protein [Methylotenera sp.]|nr:type IV secretion system DNA-binding domain-containing protein [Methylotenera sp.]
MNDQYLLVIIYGVFVALAWYVTTQYESLKDMPTARWVSFVFVLPATIESVLYFGVPGVLVGLIGLAAVYGGISLITPSSSSNEQHIRGGMLQDARDHKLLAKKKAQIDNKTGRSSTTIGGVPITKKDETLNMLFCGSPGSGKTQAFHEVIHAVLKRKERAIVFDESGDFVAKHATDRDLIFNPFDARTIGWSIMNEVRSIEDCANLANAMIPDGENSTEKQWNSYARGIIQAVLQKMYKAGDLKNRSLYDWVMIKKVSELKALCEGTPAQRAFEEGNERMVSSILTIMANSIAPWEYVPDGKFSIRDFVESEENYNGKLLFLASDAVRLKAVSPVYCAMFNLAVVAVNSLSASDERRVWFFLDELPALGALNELDALLNRARKRGAAAVVGLQSLKYLDKLFGRESTPLLLSGIGTTLVLRTNDESSAKDLAAQLGKQDVLRAVVSESSGSSGSGASQNKSTNYQTKEGAELVTSTELTRLASRVGYLKRSGEGRSILLVNIPISYKQGNFPAFIPKPNSEQFLQQKIDEVSQVENDIEVQKNQIEVNTKTEEKDFEKQVQLEKAITPRLDNVPTPTILEQSLQDILALNTVVQIQPIITGQTVHPESNASHHDHDYDDQSLNMYEPYSENDGNGSTFTGNPDV